MLLEKLMFIVTVDTHGHSVTMRAAEFETLNINLTFDH